MNGGTLFLVLFDGHIIEFLHQPKGFVFFVKGVVMFLGTLKRFYRVSRSFMVPCSK
jgi:hypothetical protein